MTKLQQIQDTIASLDPADLKELEVWIADYKFALWDQQLEADAKAGRLDHLIEKVRQNIKEGLTRSLP